VLILLDCLRGSRNTITPTNEHLAPSPPNTPLAGVLSSVSLLYPLQLKYPGRFQAFYYHTPKLYGILKAILPERYNELVGVQHTKCYMVDDDILISGANLSEQYFTNRQDRYIWIRDNSELAGFYRNLIRTICDFSFHVDDHTGVLTFPLELPDPSKDPSAFNILAKEKLQNLLSPRIKHPKTDQIQGGHDLLKIHNTWVFPTLQLGHADVIHDEIFTEFILSHQPQQEYTTYMTSPYFNIAEPYAQAMKKTRKPYRLIVASPKANGFFNGSGVSGMVPWAYDTVLREWMSVLPQDCDTQVFEYIREDWTFHAKGIWIEMNNPSSTPSNNQATSSSSSPLSKLTSMIPSLLPSTSTRKRYAFTLVGSSNFGTRSMKRDLESQLAIFTTDEDLAQRLQEEREWIFDGSVPVTAETFNQRSHNHSSLLRLLIPFSSKYM
jgi:CDP-diacylglycerol--glycerol-3-phosphate 3-phosphatidyltransferase